MNILNSSYKIYTCILYFLVTAYLLIKQIGSNTRHELRNVGMYSLLVGSYVLEHICKKYKQHINE